MKNPFRRTPVQQTSRLQAFGRDVAVAATTAIVIESLYEGGRYVSKRVKRAMQEAQARRKAATPAE